MFQSFTEIPDPLYICHRLWLSDEILDKINDFDCQGVAINEIFKKKRMLCKEQTLECSLRMNFIIHRSQNPRKPAWSYRLIGRFPGGREGGHYLQLYTEDVPLAKVCFSRVCPGRVLFSVPAG